TVEGDHEIPEHAARLAIHRMGTGNTYRRRKHYRRPGCLHYATRTWVVGLRLVQVLSGVCLLLSESMKTVLILLLSIFVLSCADRDRNGNVLDTPTNGHIVIATDESLKPLIDAELTAFQGI